MIKLVSVLELSIPESLVSYYNADTLCMRVDNENGLVVADLRLKGKYTGVSDSCSVNFFAKRSMLFMLEDKEKEFEVISVEKGYVCLDSNEFADDNEVRASVRVDWKVNLENFLEENGVDTNE